MRVFPEGASFHFTVSLEPLRVVLHCLLWSHMRPGLKLLKAAGLKPGRDEVTAMVQADLSSPG